MGKFYDQIIQLPDGSLAIKTKDSLLLHSIPTFINFKLRGELPKRRIIFYSAVFGLIVLFLGLMLIVVFLILR